MIPRPACPDVLQKLPYEAISFQLRKYLPDILITVVLVLAALVIRIGFLAEYPNTLLHEDSGPYIFEAERLLEGRETENGGVPGRPPGYPLFLAAVFRLLSSDLLHVVALQHGVAITGILLLAYTLRMMGVGRLFAYGFFVAAAFSHRLIHYDNTIGAETLTVFLMSVVIFLTCGMLLRRWNPRLVSGVLGALLAYLLLVRSASFFLPPLLAIWIAIPAASRLDANVRQRLLLAALIVLPPVLTGFAMIQWNKHHYGRSVLSREAEPVMAFVIAYSGDFTGGRYADLKREMRPSVEENRATAGEQGFYSESGGGNYQWVFTIFNVLDIDRLGSQQEKDRVVSGLFWETLLTPKTLYRHLTGHVWRETRFMLFDTTPVANSVTPPPEYAHFTRRDVASAHLASLQEDYPAGQLLARSLPGSMGETLQHFTSRYIHVNYHTEYKGKPGLIRIYSILSLILLGFLGFRLLTVRQYGALASDDSTALFVTLIWLGNALVVCTLLYALHRYSYYALPFVAFTAFYGLDRITRLVAVRFGRARPLTGS